MIESSNSSSPSVSIYDSPWWLIGMGLSLIASLFGTLGKVLMKLAHLDRRNSNMILLIASLCVVILNPMFDAMSYAYAAQSVLAPMAGLSVAWNTILSPYYLSETLTRADVKGTYAIVAGCICVGISGSHRAPTHSAHEIFALFQGTLFLFYAAIVTIASIALTVAILVLPTKHRYRRFAFGVLSGVIGGNLFFLKAVVELFATHNERIWHYVETYLILFGALGTAAGGIFVLNLGLKHFDALYLVAMYQSFLILIGSISGVIFFNETAGMHDWWQLMLYPVSILVTIYGITVISVQKSKDSYYISSEEEEQQQLITLY